MAVLAKAAESEFAMAIRLSVGGPPVVTPIATATPFKNPVG